MPSKTARIPSKRTRVADVAPLHDGSAERELAIELHTGGRLRVIDGPNGTKLTLSSPSDECLLEYDTHSGQVRIRGPLSRVALSAPREGVELSSAGDLTLQARGVVRVQGEAGVQIGAGASEHPSAPRVTLGPNALSVSAAKLRAFGQAGNLRVEECEVSGRNLRSSWQLAAISAERLEQTARDLRVRASDLIQDVEDALTTRAGRVREWIKGSRYTRAESAELRAERDVRIDGKKIHLG